MMIQKVAILAYISESHCGPQDAYEQAKQQWKQKFRIRTS